MKKLKKISLHDIDAMSDSEMKRILGGATGCENKSEMTCSGSCTSQGATGNCGWTKVPTARCTCGVVSTGPIEGPYYYY